MFIIEWLHDLYQILCEQYCPPKKRYRVTEDPDELGYWLEEIKDDAD